MAKDPYRYFRIEARELHQSLSQDALALGREGGGQEVVKRFLRHAHTLKGAARVVRASTIADAAHAMEDAIAPFRDEPASVSREAIIQVLSSLDVVAAEIADLDGPRPEGGPDAKPGGTTDLASVRIEVSRLDELLSQLTRAGVTMHAILGSAEALAEPLALARQLAALAASSGSAATTVQRLSSRLASSLEASVRRLDEQAARAERSVRAGARLASELRLLPVSEILPTMDRAIHDAAAGSDKRVRLAFSGGATRLDAHVLAALREALLHLVRNAVAHGIEPPAERSERGKPPVGMVEVSVVREARSVRVICRDDGRGIDTEALRRVAAGRMTEEDVARLGEGQILDLALRGGMSTSARVDGVSGRGVGLEAARNVIERCRGTLALRTSRGEGTTVQMSLPVSMATAQLLLVDAAGRLLGIPSEAVVRVLRVDRGEVTRVGEASALAWDGETLPFAWLHALLGWPRDAARASGRMTAVIVATGSQKTALGVSGLQGSVDVTVLPVPADAGDTPGVTGAFLGVDGQPVLVADPAWLVSAAAVGKAGSTDDGNVIPPVLVIDDSLTSRMLQRMILETAGYQVDVAASAEEALEKTAVRRHAAYLVDVELPGMDGFELVRRTRAEPRTAAVPAIVITSRGAEEDRRRGMEAGADAYFVKSRFDESELLRTLARLIGAP